MKSNLILAQNRFLFLSKNVSGHSDGITFIDAKDDERHIISNSKDQSIKLWDLRKFASNRSIEGTKEAVRNQTWDYRWDTGRRCPRRQIRIEDDPSIMTYRGHTVFKTLIRCRFSPSFSTGQKFIYTGCGTGAVKSKIFWNALICL